MGDAKANKDQNTTSNAKTCGYSSAIASCDTKAYNCQNSKTNQDNHTATNQNCDATTIYCSRSTSNCDANAATNKGREDTSTNCYLFATNTETNCWRWMGSTCCD